MANPYLTFASAEPFTIGAYGETKRWDGTLYYSTDTTTWDTWDGAAISSATHNGEHRIYMRGTGNTVITNGTKWIFTGTNIMCNGNIENLLDYDMVANGEHPPMASDCYRSLFHGCVGLTEAPELPATALASSCYRTMFHSCTGLTKAPELSATTLADYCYANMFDSCTGLTKAPELPATTLAVGCYGGMFGGCTSLTKAPELPATTLADDCYAVMFSGCTALKLSKTEAPDYPTQYRIPTSGAGTGAYRSVTNMFIDTGGTFTGTPEINRTYYGAWAATDKPIPPNPTAMLMGYMVGQAIRK